MIDREELYCDGGFGCDAHLFERDDQFVLIDCQGQWYGIEKNTGQIDRLGWNWKEEPPENYLGVFSRQPAVLYRFSLSEDRPTLEELYRVKDPGPY